ncbi:PREDICTED: putative fatty acyl-CoA reductase CG8306 [Polistes canadensis]|uniref:putative fatty acyl-CoA reductase CG8306 n=1 Tax=Polistes canadensis TaxID=91411 RepID=UPI000718C9B0|nr:PREDICTED: putative fatty acyl-CoA reductase CG8306 [Polistes canadensis]
MMGVLHTLHCDNTVTSDIVPADYVINNTIVAAWDVAQKRSMPQNIPISNGINKSKPVEQEISVYNLVSSVQNRISLFDLAEKIKNNGVLYPSERVLWYYSLSLNRNYYVNFIWTIFLHWIPAVILDSLAYLSGKKPILVEIYRKMENFYNVISFFNTRDWEFRNENVLKLWNKLSVVDKYNFFFDISDVDWECFFDIYIRGLRVYMLKDPMNTLEKGKICYRKLKIAHFTVKMLSCESQLTLPLIENNIGSARMLYYSLLFYQTIGVVIVTVVGSLSLSTFLVFIQHACCQCSIIKYVSCRTNGDFHVEDRLSDGSMKVFENAELEVLFNEDLCQQSEAIVIECN